MKYPLPQESDLRLPSMKGAVPKDNPSAVVMISVVCIDFLHVEEVQGLWLETIKLLSDSTHLVSLTLSRKAISCLKVRPL